MPHATQVFNIEKPVKHAVRFKAKDGTKRPMTAVFYLTREFAEYDLDCDDLDKVKEIEITVRIKK